MAGSFFLYHHTLSKKLQKKVKNYHFHYCLTVNILR